MEEKSKVVNFSNGIENLEQLAKFLQMRILKKYSKDIYFYIEDVNDEYILGCIDGARFMIQYEQSKRMTLEMSQGFPNAKNKLLYVLEPIMWSLHDEANNPQGFNRPILTYKTHNGSEVVEWETFDPIAKLNAVAHYYYNGGSEEVDDLKILYPETTIESLRENIKYGNFTGYLNPDIVEGAKNFTEIELYIHIKATLDTYNKYVEAAELLQVDAEEKLDMTAYFLCYLMQQTERFGVKSNPPSDEPVEPTVEQLAWIRWWSEKINELSKTHPEKFKEWEHFQYNIDPNYKPEGSYKDLIETIKSECPLAENS